MQPGQLVWLYHFCRPLLDVKADLLDSGFIHLLADKVLPILDYKPEDLDAVQ